MKQKIIAVALAAVIALAAVATQPAVRAATVISAHTTEKRQNYNSFRWNENALLIDTDEAVEILSPTITKHSAPATNGPDALEHGRNAALRCAGGGSATVINAELLSEATFSPGVFADGGNSGVLGAPSDGSKIQLSDSQILTSGYQSPALAVSHGGVITAENTDLRAPSADSVIDFFEGGGRIALQGGSCEAERGPAAKVLGTLSANSTRFTAAERAFQIEPGSVVSLMNADVIARSAAAFLPGKQTESGAASFSMFRGTLHADPADDAFCVQDCDADIYLSEVEMPKFHTLLTSNGQEDLTRIYADHQELCGDVLLFHDSDLSLYLYDSIYQGAIRHGGDNDISVTLLGNSRWHVTEDVWISAFSGDPADVICYYGAHVFVDGSPLDGVTESGGDPPFHRNTEPGATEPGAPPSTEMPTEISVIPSAPATEPETHPSTEKPTSAPAEPSENERLPWIEPSFKRLIMGDSDLDGVVTVIDATLIQRHLASLTELSALQLITSDCDGNGKVSVVDATLIQMYLASIKNSLSQVGANAY